MSKSWRMEYVLGTMPVPRAAMRRNAASERSIEFEFLQVGHASATVTVTDWRG
jgi:hypothetical protein